MAMLHGGEAVLPLGSPGGINALARAMGEAMGVADRGRRYGDTHNVAINDGRAMALYQARERRRARARLAELM